MTTKPTRIIAYMGEDEHYQPLLRQAISTALAADAGLVLYDADAATRFGSPLPTHWSGEGWEELSGDILSPDDLERAGHAKMADYVRMARAAGVTAGGWLPGSRGADTLAEYAAKIDADVIILPEDLDDRSIFDRFRGDPSPDDVTKKAHRPTLVVATGDAA